MANNGNTTNKAATPDNAQELEQLKKQLEEANAKAAAAESRAAEAEKSSAELEAQLQEIVAAKEMENTETTEKKMVKIKIPKTRKDEGDVFVSVNDYSCLIQRGVEVEVPDFVAEVLQNQEQMLLSL